MRHCLSFLFAKRNACVSLRARVTYTLFVYCFAELQIILYVLSVLTVCWVHGLRAYVQVCLICYRMRTVYLRVVARKHCILMFFVRWRPNCFLQLCTHLRSYALCACCRATHCCLCVHAFAELCTIWGSTRPHFCV